MSTLLRLGSFDLRQHTTLRVGGKAQQACVIKGRDDFEMALKEAKIMGVPARPLGGGSNLIVDEGEHKILLCKVENQGLQEVSENGHVRLTSAVLVSSTKASIASTASREAISPAACPPIPSATA